MHNPVTGEYACVVEHTGERLVSELLAVPGAPWPGRTSIPLRGEVRGRRRRIGVSTRRPSRRVSARGSGPVPPGVVHDWWNAGEGNLRARVTVTPPGLFAAMIGAAWGLAVIGRTNAKGMPKLVDAALLAEAFAHEIVFERPPQAVQRALAMTVAPIARRRGRSVTGDVMRTAIVPAERWPGPSHPGAVTPTQ